MGDYTGSVKDVRLHLYRGAYEIVGLSVLKKGTTMPEPFFTAPHTDLSLQWYALFQGKIVSDVRVISPVLNFAISRSGNTQTGADTDWTKPLKDLMPIDINEITVKGGSVTYKDFSTTPPVNLFVKNISASMRNLRNVEDTSGRLPSPVTVSGTSIGAGSFRLDGYVNILRPLPDVALDWKLEEVALPAVNTYSKAYASLDFEAGTLNIYAKNNVKDGQVSGYIKPVVRDLVIIDLRDKDKNLLEQAWEGTAAALVEVFSNQRKDQVAMRNSVLSATSNFELFW